MSRHLWLVPDSSYPVVLSPGEHSSDGETWHDWNEGADMGCKQCIVMCNLEGGPT